MEVKEVNKSAQKRITSFLSEKPIWTSWLVYSAFSGILFLIFFAAMMFMELQWWIPVVTIIGVGIILGTLTYKGKKRVTRMVNYPTYVDSGNVVSTSFTGELNSSYRIPEIDSTIIIPQDLGQN